LYFYLRLFVNAIIDDAFITFCYVRTLRGSLTWGFYAGHPTNTATSPLNVIILAVVDLFTGSPLDAAVWTALIGLTLSAVMLVRISARLFETEVFGYLAALALAANPLLISTLGLEGVLVATLLVAAIYCYVFERWYWAAVVLGLQALARPEGVLYFLVFAAFVPTHRLRLRCAAIFSVCVAPWYLFSWVFLGSFFPDTLLLKARDPWPVGDFFSGLGGCYLRVYPVATLLSFALAPLLALYCYPRIWRHRVSWLVALFGLVHFTVYSLLRPPPYHWYYVPTVTCVILLASFGLGTAYRTFCGKAWSRRLWLAATCLCLSVPPLGILYLLAGDRFAVKEMPIHSNWGSQEQYREIGLWFRQHHLKEGIVVDYEIGTIAYYSDCCMLNFFSDRSWLRPCLLRRPPGVMTTLLEIDYLFLDNAGRFPPPAYDLAEYENDLPGGDVCKKWIVSSRWKPYTRIVLSRRGKEDPGS
jgi:hypothetical protein